MYELGFFDALIPKINLIFLYLFFKVDISLLLKRSNCYILGAVTQLVPFACFTGCEVNEKARHDTESK